MAVLPKIPSRSSLLSKVKLLVLKGRKSELFRRLSGDVAIINRQNVVERMKGQALVSLLVFAAVGMIVTSAAVAITIINSQGSSKFTQGEEAIVVAEAGADNTLLRILRDPGGSLDFDETLIIGNGTADISHDPVPKTITSVGVVGSFKRKVQITYTYDNNILKVVTWQEID